MTSLLAAALRHGFLQLLQVGEAEHRRAFEEPAELVEVANQPGAILRRETQQGSGNGLDGIRRALPWAGARCGARRFGCGRKSRIRRRLRRRPLASQAGRRGFESHRPLSRAHTNSDAFHASTRNPLGAIENAAHDVQPVKRTVVNRVLIDFVTCPADATSCVKQIAPVAASGSTVGQSDRRTERSRTS